MHFRSCHVIPVIGPSQDGGYYLIGMNDKLGYLPMHRMGGEVLDELLHIAADNNIHTLL